MLFFALFCSVSVSFVSAAGDVVQVIIYNPYTDSSLSADTSSNTPVLTSVSGTYPTVWNWNVADETFCIDDTWCLCLAWLCDINSSAPNFAWTYDTVEGTLNTSVSGTPKYLQMDGTVVTLADSISYTSQVYVELVGDHVTDLGPVETEVEEVEEELETAVENWRDTDQKLDIATLTQKVTDGSAEIVQVREQYKEELESIRGLVEEAVREAATIMKKANSSLIEKLAAVAKLDTEILDTIPSLPIHFEETIRSAKLAKDLSEKMSIMNATVAGKVDGQRIIPESLYDWLVIVSTVCYVIYFVDIFIRVSGAMKRPGGGRTALEMDTCSRAGTITSVIDPEYFLRDTTPSTFELNKEKVGGRLQLRAMETEEAQ